MKDKIQNYSRMLLPEGQNTLDLFNNCDQTALKNLHLTRCVVSLNFHGKHVFKNIVCNRLENLTWQLKVCVTCLVEVENFWSDIWNPG